LLHQSKNTVPDAPFKKSWHEMALKKMIHHAATNGYDSIAITPGAEQADRYGLARHISGMSYQPDDQHFHAFDPKGDIAIREYGASPERVSQLVGKELTQKLLTAPKQNGIHILQGDDLQVGGEGMKGFYDRIVPNFLNQFGKKYGAKVGTVDIKTPSHDVPANNGEIAAAMGYSWDDFVNLPDREQLEQQYWKNQRAKTTPVHHFPITPEMREDVTKNGVPLYAEGGPVPPLRPLNPQLAAAREHMAQQSALHKAYNEAMKNVYTNQMPTFAQWVASQGKAKGGTVEEMRKAIAGAAKSSGMKAPVVANRDLTTMQDSYESLNDRVRKGAMDMQDMIESMPFKYEPGQHVFTAHSARKNLPPFQIVRKALHGNDPVREDHPKLGAGMGKPVKDPVTGKTMRTPYEPGYHVRREVDGETQEYRIPESAILGHLKAGGAVKPVGYTKEQVTVSPNLDAMRYELESVKHYTKKVK
jgi:hypothetical protein